MGIGPGRDVFIGQKTEPLEKLKKTLIKVLEDNKSKYRSKYENQLMKVMGRGK